jgi:hypothetical protein
MSCASAAGDRRPEDQTPVDYGGIRYWCHAVVDQGMVPTTPTRPGVSSPSVPAPPSSTRDTGTSSGVSGVGTSSSTAVTRQSDAAVRACGNDRLTALAIAAPFGRPKATTLSRLASLRRPSTIAAVEFGITSDWYAVSGTIASVSVTGYGLNVVLRSPDGSEVTAVIASVTCAATSTADVTARVARARSEFGKACGLPPAKGTALLTGRGSVTGLAVWRPAGSGRAGPQLAPVVAFSAQGCRRRSP